MRRYKLRILITLLAFCFGVGAFKAFGFFEDALLQHYYPVSNMSSVDIATADAREVNEIYNVVLRNLKASPEKLLVVQSESESYVYIDYSENAPKDSDEHDKFAKTVQHFMPEAETETLKNYLDVNDVSGPLRISAPDLNIALIPNVDFSDRSFWTTFHKTYPKTFNLIFLSQVGFNNRQDQALVYVGTTCGGLCGVGSYVLLGKTNGRWTIIKDEVLFVS